MIHPASFTKTQFGFQSQQERKIEQTWVLAYVYVCAVIFIHTRQLQLIRFWES